MLLGAYIYLRLMGREGLKASTDRAVLNANYLKALLEGTLEIPFGDPRKHEFVASAADIKRKTGVTTLQIAKGLLEDGYHAPTIYFPQLVEEALMFAPTETDSQEELKELAEAVKAVVARALQNPDRLTLAPQNLAVGRVDEVAAARRPILSFADLANSDSN